MRGAVGSVTGTEASGRPLSEKSCSMWAGAPSSARAALASRDATRRPLPLCEMATAVGVPSTWSQRMKRPVEGHQRAQHRPPSCSPSRPPPPPPPLPLMPLQPPSETRWAPERTRSTCVLRAAQRRRLRWPVSTWTGRGATTCPVAPAGEGWYSAQTTRVVSAEPVSTVLPSAPTTRHVIAPVCCWACTETSGAVSEVARKAWSQCPPESSHPPSAETP
mmetsp:Transcript_57327/g.113825  ORF Transcript_57327/g.113825 Transcript_57327/m.113825 type:complete len:219 (-) Transcript_57327:67-723(-)